VLKSCEQFEKRELLDEERLMQAAQALGEWPETEGLRVSAIGRIRELLDKNSIRGFLLFCPRSLPQVDEWQARAINLTNINLGRHVIIAGSTWPPSNEVELVKVSWQTFLSDVSELAPKPEAAASKAIAGDSRSCLLKGFIKFLSGLATFDATPGSKGNNGLRRRIAGTLSLRDFASRHVPCHLNI